MNLKTCGKFKLSFEIPQNFPVFSMNFLLSLDTKRFIFEQKKNTKERFTFLFCSQIRKKMDENPRIALKKVKKFRLDLAESKDAKLGKWTQKKTKNHKFVK